MPQSQSSPSESSDLQLWPRRLCVIDRRLTQVPIVDLMRLVSSHLSGGQVEDRHGLCLEAAEAIESRIGLATPIDPVR